MKSRFLTRCGVSAAVLLTTITGSFPAAMLHASAAPSGDLNGDGKLNASDVRMLADFLVGKSSALDNWNNADYDGNRMLDSVDLTRMKRAAAAAPVQREEDTVPKYIHC